MPLVPSRLVDVSLPPFYLPRPGGRGVAPLSSGFVVPALVLFGSGSSLPVCVGVAVRVVRVVCSRGARGSLGLVPVAPPRCLRPSSAPFVSGPPLCPSSKITSVMFTSLV